MIVKCSECAARYLIDPAALGAEGRVVRCGKCAHSWVQIPNEVTETAEPTSAEEPVFAVPPPPRPGEQPQGGGGQRRRGSNVPALRRHRRPSRLRARAAWLALFVVVGAIVGGATHYRPQVLETWPAAERLYEAVGFPSEPPGFGLSLVNVKFDQKTAEGTAVLMVEGEIRNVSEKERDVPGLRATLFGKNQRELQNWTFIAPVPKLLPGENVQFRTSVKNPAEGAVRLTIVFHAPKP